MSERRRSAVALSSRAHAFSVEALIGSNKKRKLRDWEEKGLDLSMEALSPAGPLGDTEDAAAHGLEPHPGECAGPDRGRRAEWCGRRPCSLTPCLAPTRVSFSLRKRLEPSPNSLRTIWGGTEPCIVFANLRQRGFARIPFSSGSGAHCCGVHS